MNWLKDRFKERTSWDGASLIVVSLIALFFTPLIKWAAIAGLIYGAWTIWKSE
jgi:hypothetical protein|tara:strand:+ start:27 stop:185 length:159 start_codon:yes stop_codon:yes gene_type:complete